MPLGGDDGRSDVFHKREPRDPDEAKYLNASARGGQGKNLRLHRLAAGDAWKKQRWTLCATGGAPFTVGMFGVATRMTTSRWPGWGRYPIHVPTLLVIVHVACMILPVSCSPLAGAGSRLCSCLDSAQVFSAGRVWQLATYAFVHPPSGLIWFAIEMYMLFVFGREVERFIGRRAFIALYLCLLWSLRVCFASGGSGNGRVGRFSHDFISPSSSLLPPFIHNVDTLPPHPGEMGRAHFRRRLLPAIAGLSRLVELAVLG
jgi:hypothetical protein